MNIWVVLADSILGFLITFGTTLLALLTQEGVNKFNDISETAYAAAFIGSAVSATKVIQSRLTDGYGRSVVGGNGITGIFVMAAVSVIVLALAGCGTMNAYTSAALNSSAQDYVGMRRNAQNADDMKLAAWLDIACTMPVGALQRRPDAVPAILLACPVPSLEVAQ